MFHFLTSDGLATTDYMSSADMISRWIPGVLFWEQMVMAEVIQKT